MIQFLFRKVAATKSHPERIPHRSWPLTLKSKFRLEPAKGAQWTEKIASSLDQKVDEGRPTCLDRKDHNLHESVDLALRLEGPYFSPADPSRYHTVVCLVAGTGVSGAIAIAGAFRALQSLRSAAGSGASVFPPTEAVWRRCIVVWSVREADFVHLPPLDSNHNIELQVCLTGPGKPRHDIAAIMAKTAQSMPSDTGIWAYISGPKGFIDNAKTVCKTIRNLEYYAASWDI